LEEEFGSNNCPFTTPHPIDPKDAVTWHFCRDENAGVDIQFEAVGLNSPYPGNIKVVYDNGYSSEITLHDDCNDFDRVSDFLRDIERPPQDDCNQLTDVISLMEEKFGQENCDEFSAFPQGLTVTCSIEDVTGRGTITAKLNAPYNEDHIATPSDITLGYGGGIVGTIPVVEFSNDCTGDDLQNVQDLLKDINNDTDGILLCPAVYEPVACGENLDAIFSNQCEANIAQFDKDQCTCYEKDDIMFLMEEKMGVNNCAYNTDIALDQDYFLYECKNAMGQTASLYSSEIEIPESLFFAANGGSNTDVVLFENDCNDLTDTVAFFANNGM